MLKRIAPALAAVAVGGCGGSTTATVTSPVTYGDDGALCTLERGRGIPAERGVWQNRSCLTARVLGARCSGGGRWVYFAENGGSFDCLPAPEAARATATGGEGSDAREALASRLTSPTP